MRMKVSTSKRILALLSCAVLCLTAIGTECFHSFVIGAETDAENTAKEAVFQFDSENEIQAAYYPYSSKKPVVTSDAKDISVLSMLADGDNAAHVQLPYVLKANTTYYYSINYRVYSQNGSNPDGKNTTVLQLYSTADAKGFSSSKGIVNGQTAVAKPFSWVTLEKSENYETLKGSFTTDSTAVTDEFKYLTLFYKTNKGLTQTLYIDKIGIYPALSDVTDSYEFDFENPSELVKAYSYPGGHLPEISQDGNKNVLEMNSGNGKVFARLPFKLEAGKKYNYSISYRVASKDDTAEGKTTVLKLISSGENDNINSLAGAGSKRNLSTLLSWKEVKVSNEYTTLSGSFEATDSNVTGEYQYLTIHYETNKNFEQTLYIDKIIINSEKTPEVMPDVTGAYEFDFNNKGELAKAYSYPGGHLPEISQDGNKNVLEMNSGNGKVFARLPFKLETGKIYKYSIVYRIASKDEAAEDKKTTVLKLISSGENDNINSLAGAGSKRNLSTLLSWKEVKVSNEYTTVRGDFTTTASNVTGEYQYLTIHYETNKSFQQKLYIDKISIWEYTIPEARNKYKNPVTFEFDNMEDVDYTSNDTAQIAIDPATGKEALCIKATPGSVAVRLPYKIKANMAYKVTVNYRVNKTVNDKYYLQLVSGTREFEPNFWCDNQKKAYLLKELLYWVVMPESNEYTSLQTVLFIKAKDVANDNDWLTLRLKSGMNLNVNFYIGSVTVDEMTYLDASHNVDIMDYNWSANPENTAKYVDWEKWISKTAAAELNGDKKNNGTKNGDRKMFDVKDSLNIVIIVVAVAAVVVAAGGTLFVLLKKRKNKTT